MLDNDKIIFEVYRHEFTNSVKHKVYIGYTKMGVAARLHKHYTNAIAGSDTKFARAIRKYGISFISTQILWAGISEDTAKEMERFYIQQYDSFKNGYNMTLGGDGGWCVPEEKYERWLAGMHRPLEKNSRWSGYSDDNLVDLFYLDWLSYPDGWCFIRAWERLILIHEKLPKTISKNRFPNFPQTFGVRRLISSIEFKYNVNIGRYKRDLEHSKKLSKTQFKTNSHWYYNILLKQNKQLLASEVTEGWVRGRKLKWD